MYETAHGALRLATADVREPIAASRIVLFTSRIVQPSKGFVVIRRLSIVVSALVCALALPVAAQAAPVWSTSTLATSGSYTSGELLTVTVDVVNTGNATGGTAGTLTLSAGYGNTFAIEGTPTLSDGPGAGANMSSHLTATAGSAEIVVDNSFGAGDARIVFQARLPKRFKDGFQFMATGTLGAAYLSAYDPTTHAVSKAGGSQLFITTLTPMPRVAKKDQSYTVRYRITNKGTGVAPFAAIQLTGVYGTANALSPTPPTFTPTATFTSGCASMVGSDYCIVANELAAGASAEVEVRFDNLTHYGDVNAYVYGYAADRSDYAYGYSSFDVTDGSFSQNTMWMTGPDTASGNADFTFAGGIAASADAAIGQSQLELTVTGVDADGRDSSSADATQVVKSITLSNGAACAKKVVGATTYNNTWTCPISGIAAGQRVEYTIVANAPSAMQNLDIEASAQFVSTTGLADNSSYAWTMVNPARATSYKASVSAPKVVGVDRVATVTVTFTNTGTEAIAYPGLELATVNGFGRFLDAAASGCAQRQHDDSVWCGASVTLEPGQSRSWTLRVKAPSTRGTLMLVVTDVDWSTLVGDSYYGHTPELYAATAMQVVKPKLAPFVGVKPAKVASTNVSQLTQKGLSNSFTCPDSCKALVQLRVSRVVAKRLRLVSSGKGSPFVVIGSGAKSRSGAGKVTATAKIAAKYKAAVARLGVPLPLQRVATVTSTSADTKDATWTATANLSIAPKPRR